MILGQKIYQIFRFVRAAHIAGQNVVPLRIALWCRLALAVGNKLVVDSVIVQSLLPQVAD